MNSFDWILLIISSSAIAFALFYARRSQDRYSNQIIGMLPPLQKINKGELDGQIDTASLTIPLLQTLAAEINLLAAKTKADLADTKRLERVRSEFLGNVSHELRTPMFTVQGFLETLIDGAAEDESVREDFLKKAHHNVMRLHTLLNDLIEISRLESGEMKMSMRYFDAGDFFGRIVEELRPTAEIAGITLSFNISGGDAGDQMVYGDRNRLKQAMVNLIENGIKYNRPNGSVTVQVIMFSDHASVSVSDTGIGIPEADIGRIFERFYRVSKDRSRAVGGSGLGLSIVKHIIEAHGSTVSVTSAVNAGTTFSFRLKR